MLRLALVTTVLEDYTFKRGPDGSSSGLTSCRARRGAIRGAEVGCYSMYDGITHCLGRAVALPARIYYSERAVAALARNHYSDRAVAGPALVIVASV